MSKTRKIVDSLVTASGNSLIAQLVERRTVNPQVPGSSPGRGAKQINGLVFGLGRFRLLGDILAVLAGIIWPGAIKSVETKCRDDGLSNSNTASCRHQL